MKSNSRVVDSVRSWVNAGKWSSRGPTLAVIETRTGEGHCPKRGCVRRVACSFLWKRYMPQCERIVTKVVAWCHHLPLELGKERLASARVRPSCSICWQTFQHRHFVGRPFVHRPHK
jgi:hypothetical protein